ncbi:unnamed protein product, partial [Medioppia subpectinata]
VPILDRLSAQIPRGKIYALLGANGVGKTTLIRAILGRLKLSSGSILVFGVRPASLGSDIPGPGVGYMPQELALFDEFTIEEILQYYGLLYHMKGSDCKERIVELIQVLNLPEKTRRIDRLSGGQQRRVSIAVTLLHRPKLIILDEPTVGVDSLLRHRMWQYLEDLCKTYEEARSASTVAFMSSGTILKESDPNILMAEHQCNTLEEVFLQLVTQTKSINNKSYDQNTCNTTQLYDNNCNNEKFIDLTRVRAMLWKYYILTNRRPLFLFMFYIIPIIALISMQLTVGQSPYNIPVGLYNGDTQPAELSRQYIRSINAQYLRLNEFPNSTRAVQSVREGRNFMAIEFSENFTNAFNARLTDILEMSDDDLDNSQIKLYVDMSNIALVLFVFKNIFEAFERFSHSLSHTVGYDLYKYMSPVSIETPIYGRVELDVSNHFAPSIIIVLAQCLPMVLSALQIIYDRKNTSLERMLVAGVRPMEFYLAHVTQNSSLIIIHVFSLMFIAFKILGVTCLGSYVNIYLLLVWQALLGMSIGLMGALILSDEVSVAVFCGPWSLYLLTSGTSLI